MKINIDQWLHDNTLDLQGRVVVITGAAGGLGSKVCRYLVKCNAKIIMLERNVEGMETLSKTLREEFPNAEIECMALDLNQLKSVNDVVMNLVNRRIDYLILNAGVYNVPLATSELGYNNVFQINFISQYYMVKQLLPALQRTKGKVVAVTSIAHSSVKFDEQDIDYTKHAKNTKVYGNSKRCLTLALSELFKDRDDVRLALVHPGVSLTPLTNMKKSKFVDVTMRWIFPSNEVASLSIVRGLFVEPKYDEWVGPKSGPKNFKAWGLPAIYKLPAATAEERAKIFNLAESLCKLIEKADRI